MEGSLSLMFRGAPVGGTKGVVISGTARNFTKLVGNIPLSPFKTPSHHPSSTWKTKFFFPVTCVHHLSIPPPPPQKKTKKQQQQQQKCTYMYATHCVPQLHS